jgi:hypothetical protein
VEEIQDLENGYSGSNWCRIFEFLKLIEQFCKEHNIPPTNYEHRCTVLLLGIQKVHLRVMVLPYVQDIGNYSADGTDKWSELRRVLLHQNAPPHCDT